MVNTFVPMMGTFFGRCDFESDILGNVYSAIHSVGMSGLCEAEKYVSGSDLSFSVFHGYVIINKNIARKEICFESYRVTY